jgi:hypothetical protein
VLDAGKAGGDIVDLPPELRACALELRARALDLRLELRACALEISACALERFAEDFELTAEIFDQYGDVGVFHRIHLTSIVALRDAMHAGTARRMPARFIEKARLRPGQLAQVPAHAF